MMNLLRDAWQSIVRRDPLSTDKGKSELVFLNVWLHIHPAKVKKENLKVKHTFYLGFITFFLFLILVTTGVALMFYYRPHPPQAYQDMKDLQFVVYLGSFLRNMHRWSAHGMVICVFLHMCRVFYTGSYKRPRQFNWVIGVVLFLLTLGLSFTGYLAALGPARLLGDLRWEPTLVATLHWWARAFASCCWEATRSARRRCCASTCCTWRCCPRWSRC